MFCSECANDCSDTSQGSCSAKSTEGDGKCDGTGKCSDGDDDVTNDCTACATAPDGFCAPKLAKCENQDDCVAFYDCLMSCPGS